MGRLTDAIKGLYGFKAVTRQNPEVLVLQVAVTRFLPTDDDRLAFVIVNLGVNIAYINISNDVSATNGIELSANGGSVAMNFKEDFDMVGSCWYGTAPGGAVNILVLEVSGE